MKRDSTEAAGSQAKKPDFARKAFRLRFCDPCLLKQL